MVKLKKKIMKKFRITLVAIVLVVLSAFTISESISWKVSDNYSIKFAGTDAEGIFKTLTGDIVFDQDNLAASKCNFTVDVNSINTGNGTKNKHAVSKNWFDAEKFPKIKFASQKFGKTDNGYLVTGTMMIHGVKKEMTLPFTFSNSTFKSKFSLNRMDFGVGTMKGMSKKVSNEIKLDISIPVSKL